MKTQVYDKIILQLKYILYLWDNTLLMTILFNLFLLKIKLKSFYPDEILGPMLQNLNGRNLLMLVISHSVSPWQAGSP
jgi:hypothetical protein